MDGRMQFACDSGEKRFDVSRINDNYCDCADGSDEPGTSACSYTGAVFHCANAGFFSQDLPTSRVNDQICGASMRIGCGNAHVSGPLSLRWFACVKKIVAMARTSMQAARTAP